MQLLHWISHFIVLFEYVKFTPRQKFELMMQSMCVALIMFAVKSGSAKTGLMLLQTIFEEAQGHTEDTCAGFGGF